MITTSVCRIFHLDSLNGVHQPNDEYRIALYTADAELGDLTERYTSVDEVVGRGYEARGLVLKGRTALLDRGVGILTFNPAVWPVATITARGALIFNATKDRAIATFNFGENVSSTKKEFEVTLPPATAEEALIQIGRPVLAAA